MAAPIILLVAVTASFLTLLMVMGVREEPTLIVAAGPATTEVVVETEVSEPVEVDPVGVYDLETYNSGVLGNNPNRTFRSSSIVAPEFGINIWDAAHLRTHSLPFLFLTATEPDSSASPFILNATDLSLIWADTTTDRHAAMNFRSQSYRGQKFLTFWEGINASGRGNGTCVFYDQSYQERYRIGAKDIGIGADLHECQVTPEGTALITAYPLVPYNLVSVGGREEDWLLDSYFQEIDIETGEVIFCWAASEWFSPMDSYEPIKPNYDFFHLNSIQKDRNGNYLISSRHTHIIALIAGKDAEIPGEPIWILNGKRNQFRDISDGRALEFSWQHHARFRNDEGTHITLFDNHHPSNSPGDTGCEHSCSKGMEVHLNLENMTVSLAAEYYHPQSVQSGSMGSFQALDVEGVADGNMLVGWGSNPGLSEYASDGRCVMDIQFGAYKPGYKFGCTVSSYRAFKGDWIGLPATKPDISADWINHEIYVSWNGATEVRSWAVYVGEESEEDNVEVKYLQTTAKDGFETRIYVPHHAWVEVRGLNENGEVLGSTSIWDYEFNMKMEVISGQLETA